VASEAEAEVVAVEAETEVEAAAVPLTSEQYSDLGLGQIEEESTAEAAVFAAV